MKTTYHNVHLERRKASFLPYGELRHMSCSASLRCIAIEDWATAFKDHAYGVLEYFLRVWGVRLSHVYHRKNTGINDRDIGTFECCSLCFAVWYAIRLLWCFDAKG